MNTHEIIKKQCSLFLSFVMKDADRRKLHPLSRRFGGFPLFFSNNALLYDQMNAETIIESSIRRYLVNGILKEFFSKEYCDSHKISCEWTLVQNHDLINSIDYLENYLPYPVEFVITSMGNRTGYRYTNLYGGEERISKLFQNKSLDNLIIIDFSSSSISTFVHKNTILSEKYRNKVKIISFEDFITQFFSDVVFKEYIDEIQKVISLGYDYVGLQTIQNLNFQYLPHFIARLRNTILSSSVENKSYQIVNMSLLQSRKWKWTLSKLQNLQGSITSSDSETIKQNFYTRLRYLSLCGCKDFAHSFITSEYLYMTMKDNNQFDYTAIVCGFLKSIEQLIYMIMLSSLNKNVSGLYIKRNNNRWVERQQEPSYTYPNNRNAKHIPFEKQYEKYFDTTFMPLVNFLDDFKDGWEISSDAVSLIATYLSMFCIECRNEHFHKDNISNIDEVEKIRDNAWLLLYWTIGGIKLTNNQEDNNSILGIRNDAFDRMYWSILRYSSGGDYFLIKFPSQDPMLVAMPQNQEEKHINEHGLLVNTRLRFIKLNRGSLGEWQNDDWTKLDNELSDALVVFIDEKNLPDEIYYIDKITGELSQIKW